MEMKVNKSFFLLERRDAKKAITIFDNIEDSVKKVADYIRDGATSESIALSNIEVADDKLSVKGIPWSVITEKLVKGSK